MPDPLKPSLSLLVKLGSIAVHAAEAMSPDGHEYDRTAFESLMADAEVVEWFGQMGKMAMLPVKRK